MPAEEKEYAVIEEATEIIKQLKEVYEDELWTVIPEEVIVLGVSNKERPEKQKNLAKTRRFVGPIKAILEEFSIGKKYMIELYYSDWSIWTPARRQWILFKELLHIPNPNKKGLIKHDIEDFSVIMDAHGTSHWFDQESLPDMLNGDKVEFNQDLIVSRQLDEEDEG